MLYALGRPVSFVVLLLSFVVGITLHHWVQAVVAMRLGDARPRMERRGEADPRRQVDPFGAVAALISGLGWGKPVELLGPRRRQATWLVALVGPLVNIVLGVGLLVLWRVLLADGASQGVAAAYSVVGAADLLQHGVPMLGDAVGVVVLLLGASQLYLGVLSLVPLPPLDGGRLLFALAPRTPGWQRAEHYLVQQNIGVFVCLALLLLPLGNDLLLPQLLDAVLQPVMKALLGG